MTRGIVLARVGAVFLLAVAGAAIAGEPSGKTVVFDRRPGPRRGDRAVLLREIVREAVILAAREELGAHTWDMVLHPHTAGPKDATQVHVSTVALPRKIEIAVELQSGGKAREIWKKSIPAAPKKELYYARLVSDVEQLSRQELPAALTEAGIARTTRERRPLAPERLAQIEARLEIMNFACQWRAVRDLHQATRSNGDAPPLLIGLSRGYAHLGRLTGFYWHAMGDALTARSLLYAQRLAATHPDSLEVLYSRAYAEAFAGMHNDALRDLAEARKRRDDDAPPPPWWVAPLTAYCRYDREALAASAEQFPDREVIPLLQAMTMQFCASGNQRQRAAEAVIARIPDCLPGYQLLFSVPSLETKGRCGSAANHAMRVLLPRILGSFEDLPEAVRPLIARNPAAAATPWANAPDTGVEPTRPLVIRALRAAAEDDPEELNWACLADMIEEATFHHTYYQISFLWNWLNVPTEEHLEQALQRIPDHPYRGYLESMQGACRRDLARYRKCFANISIIDPDLRMEPMVHAALKLNDPKRMIGKKAHNEMYYLADMTAFDRERVLLRRCRLSNPNRKVVLGEARLLRKISPFSPAAITALIQYGPEDLKQWSEWERLAAEYPSIARTFAERHAGAGRPGRAAAFYEQYLRQAQDKDAFFALADIYRQSGDDARCLATLKRALDAPESGLSHASIRSRIAHHLMNRGEWEAARPYAEGAASSWSAWGMGCAVRCMEGLKEWEQAEQWVRRISQRYENSQMDWYFWCQRTGRGKLDEARALAAARVALIERSTSSDDQSDVARFHTLEGSQEAALACWLKAFNGPKKESYHGVHAALAALELGRGEEVDHLLARVDQEGAEHAGTCTSCARIRRFAAALAAHRRDADDARLREAAEKLCPKSAPETERNRIRYIYGKYSELLGNRDLAREQYQLTFGKPDGCAANHIFAGYALRRLDAQAE